MRTVIIGASVAGAKTAQALLALGYAGDVVLIDAQAELPYDRPPLSKSVLAGEVPPRLLTETELADERLTLRTATRAVAFDPATREVELGDGSRVGGSSVVLATGLVPRRLADRSLAGIHYLRTLADAVALRRAARHGVRAVVVGGGFIGAEVATALHDAGARVTVVEAAAAPLAEIVGDDVSKLLMELPTSVGIELVTGVGAVGFRGDRAVTGVKLTDGSTLDADLVVVGIGAVPDLSWLEGSGLPIDNGVRCTETFEIAGHHDIYAIGDIARWPHPRFGYLRAEHWTAACEHASAVAAKLVGQPAPLPQPPYAWSDQYGHRLQMLGIPAAGRPVSIEGDVYGDGLHAVYEDDGGALVGVVALNRPRSIAKYRRALVRNDVRQGEG